MIDYAPLQLAVEPVARLSRIREDLQTIETWPEVHVDGALLLLDVCEALGLDHESTALVLGQEAAQYVQQTGL